MIERYMLRQLVVVAALVTLTLTLAIWLTQSLRFVELIVNRGLSLHSYLYLTLLLLPSFLSLMLPVSLFTAVLFTYNKLITDSELIVLRAAGLGPFQLARPALLLASIVVLMGYVLSLYLLPWSYRQFKDLEFNVRTDYSAVLLKEGAFNNISAGITVYIRSREPDGELQGILDPRQPRARQVVHPDGRARPPRDHRRGPARHPGQRQPAAGRPGKRQSCRCSTSIATASISARSARPSRTGGASRANASCTSCFFRATIRTTRRMPAACAPRRITA